MPKFTIFWLIVYFGGMLASFLNPLYGVLVYLFEYYLRPVLHWWGNPLPDWRWNLVVGIVALATFLIRRGSLPKLPQVKNPSLPWFIALICTMAIVSTWAVVPETSWDQTVAFAKLLIIYGLLIGVVRSQWMFDAVMAVHIAGAGWWGWESYIDPRRVSGRLLYVGSSDTLNDNLAAAHLLTVVPILCVYALTAKDKRLRVLAILTAPFIVNTFILCNSRGATVGLAAGFLTAVLLARAGHRIRMLGVALAVSVMFLVLADPQFIERQQTITDEDAGAERFETWQGALRLLNDYPLGVGGGGFAFLSPVYIPNVTARYDGDLRAVHNTYLLIATEWGLQGLFIFAGFITTTFLTLNRTRRRARTVDDSLYYRIVAVEVALVGTLTAAIFSNRFTGESIYWMCALAFALYRVQALNHEAVASEPATSDTPRPKYRPAATAATG